MTPDECNPRVACRMRTDGHWKAVHDYGEQERQWAKHKREMNAQGKCEHSGLELRRCITGICDCGWEYLPDDQISTEIGKLVIAARQEMEDDHA